jgi:PST family polysaccharide transporter
VTVDSLRDAGSAPDANAAYLATATASSLGRRAARGGAIAVAAQIIRIGVQIVSAIVLSRLLAPEDFGLIAMATATTGLFSSLTDLGLNTATIQSREVDQNSTSALFFINVGVGLAIMLMIVASTPLSVLVFHDDRLYALVPAMALTIPITASAAQHLALLSRRMEWGKLHFVNVFAPVLGLAVAIVCAGGTQLGFWSLVAQAWTTAIVTLSLALMLCPWRPSRVREWSAARGSIRFGLNLTGFNVSNYLHRQADNALIGWRWGATELGFYSRAYSLLMLPLGIVNGPIGSALLPALSRLQEDRTRWRAAYLQTLCLITILGAATAAGLYTVSGSLVTVAFGRRWETSAEIFQLLSLSALTAIPANTCGWILMSLGRSDRLFKWGLFASPLFAASFVVGLPWGGKGVALAYSVTMTVLAPIYFVYSVRGTGLAMKQIMAVTLPAIAVAVLAAGLTQIIVPHLAVQSPAAQLAVDCAVYGSIVGVLLCGLFMLNPTYRATIRRAAQVLPVIRKWHRSEPASDQSPA